MGKLPCFPFYPGDWLRDSVSGCTLAAQGLWLRMMIVMHDSPRYGYLTSNGGSPMLPEAIARRCGCTIEEYLPLFDELKRTGIPHISDDGMISCRRMVRDAKIRQQGAEKQARLRERGGGDPHRWTAIRVRILQMDQHTCAYCGRRAQTVDHVIPKSAGGTEDDSNLVACCKKCNFTKSIRTPEQANMTFWRGFTRLNLDSDQKVTCASSSSSSVSLKKETRKKEKTVSVFSLPDWFGKETWDEFLAHRKSTKAPVAEKSYAGLIRRFDKLRSAGYPPQVVVDKLVEKGWRWFYPESAKQQPAAQSPQENPLSRQKASDIINQWKKED